MPQVVEGEASAGVELTVAVENDAGSSNSCALVRRLRVVGRKCNPRVDTNLAKAAVSGQVVSVTIKFRKAETAVGSAVARTAVACCGRRIPIDSAAMMAARVSAQNRLLNTGAVAIAKRCIQQTANVIAEGALCNVTTASAARVAIANQASSIRAWCLTHWQCCDTRGHSSGIANGRSGGWRKLASAGARRRSSCGVQVRHNGRQTSRNASRIGR